MGWPIYRLNRNNKRIALNCNLVSAVHEKDNNVTEVYTLDCAKDDDAWDLKAPFDEVVKDLQVGHRVSELREQIKAANKVIKYCSKNFTMEDLGQTIKKIELFKEYYKSYPLEKEENQCH